VDQGNREAGPALLDFVNAVREAIEQFLSLSRP
jgi:hypothetical protein